MATLSQKNTKYFNDQYLKLHIPKEDLFWKTYMGTASDAEKKLFEKAEMALKDYISDASKIAEVKQAIQALDPQSPNYAQELKGLNGWLQFFDCNAIENEEAKKIQAELVALEADLFEKRSKVQLKFKNAQGQEEVASTNVLSMNLSTAENEEVRKSSHQALLDLEKWVVANGYLKIVSKRNEFARCLGYKNYFEYRVKKNENMSVEELFSILGEFESLTRKKCFDEIEKLKAQKGPTAAEGHNIRFFTTGDAKKQTDPYFPFEKSIQNWVDSFARLGIDYRKARLTLDLFDRRGKYENGFMHAPVSSYYDEKTWVPARINFTSNATPSQIGSGQDGLFTLFHEGGHAAHFSNIALNGVCFSQEFPPTSMAYAETQSMFLDSIINDADWLKTYAKDLKGQAIPDEIIQLDQSKAHPWKAFAERSIMIVGVFERRLYEMKESELTGEAAIALARSVEKEVLGISCSPRPLLAIPHLLSDSSSCSYYGYLLAHMAVYQTRAYFIGKYGYICDNPHIGPELTLKYWNPGNSLSHKETVKNLTSKNLSGQDLAAYCNMSTEELWKKSQDALVALNERKQSSVDPHKRSLNAFIEVVDGDKKIANNESSDFEMYAQFEDYIQKNYRA